jgi:hypothetical protein
LKLLSEFRKQVNHLGVGNIRQAWFTSFNLSPHFVETYILQALAGQNERMSSIADYEALQQKLLDQDIDIRFFSDEAAIDPSEPKRTSFHFHLVSPEILAPQLGNGVFHPKVIFLCDRDGNAIVGAGSSNLTVSGWGRNREAFLFRKISDVENRNRVLAFFRSLFVGVSAEFPELQISLDNEKASLPNWKFLSSLNGDRLFDHLAEGKGETLSVWSPYFSEDIVEFKRKFVDQQLGADVQMVVYPDLIDDAGYTKIRIPDRSGIKQRLLDCNDIVFRKMHWEDSGSDVAMTHAKLWQFGQRMAVGSWNCTQAGTNVHLYDDSGASTCNVEAGILSTDAIIENVHSQELPVQDCLMPDDQLIREKEDLPKASDRLPFFLEAVFDWRTRLYTLTLKNFPNGESWLMRLPGVKDSVSLQLGDESLVIPGVAVNQLLKKRTYSVQKDGGHNVYTGIVIEKGVRERPAYRFETFSDLLDAWNSGKPEAQNQMQAAVTVKQSEGLEEFGDIALQPEKSVRPDYFRMFRAFQNMREKFTAKPDEGETRRLIQAYPGSLRETAEKIREIVEDKEFSDVFRWLLKMEYQTVLKTAREQAMQHGLEIDWTGLSLSDIQTDITGADSDLISLVVELADYERSAA